MKTNLYGVTLGAACSAMLIFGSNTAFATEYSLTEKIKVDLKADITTVVKSTYNSTFTHPDRETSITKKHASYLGTHLDETEYELHYGKGSAVLRSLESLPPQSLGFELDGNVEMIFSVNYSESIDFLSRAKFTNIVSDHGKHEGSTHDNSFWLKNIITFGVQTSDYGTFELGAIDNVFDYVLTPVPVLHRQVNRSLNSVPSELITTSSVRSNIFGLSWHYSLDDIMFLGATLKPTTGLKGLEQDIEDNFIEYGLASETRLGGPGLLVRAGLAYMSEIPHDFASLGFYESFFNASGIIGLNLSFEFPGWKVGSSYKYRFSKSVVDDKYTPEGKTEAKKKVENFYFHQLEMGMTFHPGDTDWVLNEEFRNWSLGAKFTLLVDSSDPSYVVYMADNKGTASDKIVKEGEDWLLGLKKRPVAFQIDFSAKRSFSDTFTVFGGARFTLDQGVGMYDFYRFNTEAAPGLERRHATLKLKEGKELKLLRPLNYLDMVLYIGISASLR